MENFGTGVLIRRKKFAEQKLFLENKDSEGRKIPPRVYRVVSHMWDSQAERAVYVICPEDKTGFEHWTLTLSGGWTRATDGERTASLKYRLSVEALQSLVVA